MLMILPSRARTMSRTHKRHRRNTELKLVLDDLVPLLVFHAHREVVANDRSVVDERVNAPEFRLRRLQRLLRSAPRRVMFEHEAAPFDPLLLQSMPISARRPPASSPCPPRWPLRAELERDRLPDTARSTGDQREFSFQWLHDAGAFASARRLASCWHPSAPTALIPGAARLFRPVSTDPRPAFDDGVTPQRRR